MENCERFMLDLSSTVEVVKEAVALNSSKIYISGKLLCDASYDYLVILSNPTQLFPTLTVLHLVDLVSKDAAKPPYEISNTPENSSRDNTCHLTSTNSISEKLNSNSGKFQDEEKEAKILDLLNFVQEIAKSEDLIKDNHGLKRFETNLTAEKVSEKEEEDTSNTT